jgi:hypothetical protein
MTFILSFQLNATKRLVINYYADRKRDIRDAGCRGKGFAALYSCDDPKGKKMFLSRYDNGRYSYLYYLPFGSSQEYKAAPPLSIARPNPRV